MPRHTLDAVEEGRCYIRRGSQNAQHEFVAVCDCGEKPCPECRRDRREEDR